MKRERLVWFAAGAGVSSLTFALAALAFAERPNPVPMLAIEERIDRLLALNDRELRETGPLNGRLIHRCRAKAFEMDSIEIDGGGQARVPITEESLPVINCILMEGMQDDFQMSVTYSPQPRLNWR